MNCRVCQQRLEASQTFCPQCGEKINPNRLTVKLLFSNFLSEFLDYDNRLLKTFRHLFAKPDRVLNSYIRGDRKQYVNVLGYLSISLTLVAIQTFILKNYFPELLVVEQNDLPKEFDISPIMNAMYDYQGLLTIALTPLSAMVSRLVFIDNEKYNLAEHMIINIYPTAQFYIVWFFFTALIVGFGMPYQQVTLVILPVLMIYMGYIFKRIYDITFLIALLRTTIYFVLYMILFILIYTIVIIGYFAYLSASGQLEF